MSALRQLCRCTGSSMLDGLYPRTARRAQPRLCNGQCHRPRLSLRFRPLALRFAFRLRHQRAFRWLNVDSPLNRPGRQLQPSRTDVKSGANSNKESNLSAAWTTTNAFTTNRRWARRFHRVVGKAQPRLPICSVEHASTSSLDGVSVPRRYGHEPHLACLRANAPQPKLVR